MSCRLRCGSSVRPDCKQRRRSLSSLLGERAGLHRLPHGDHVPRRRLDAGRMHPGILRVRMPQRPERRHGQQWRLIRRRRGIAGLLQDLWFELEALRGLLHPAQFDMSHFGRLRMLRAMVVSTVLLAGCGAAPLPNAPQLGTECDGGDSAASRVCYTSTSFAFCGAGTWDEYPCDGNCSASGATRCAPRIVVGETCPSSWQGYGSCLSATELASCQGGKWVSRSCSCSNANGIVSCT